MEIHDRLISSRKNIEKKTDFSFDLLPHKASILIDNPYENSIMC